MKKRFYRFKKAYLCASLALISFSCQEGNELSQPVNLSQDQKELLMHDFSNALGKALNTEPELREFVKKEAVKQFDGDYDILYQLVKDTKLPSGKTFGSILANHFSSRKKLNTINTNFLDLNIKAIGFDLPVEYWDTQKFTPLVVVRGYDEKAKELTAYNGQGEKIMLEAHTNPTQTVIVVEESERIDVNSLATLNDDVSRGVAMYSLACMPEPQNPTARTSEPAWYGADCPRKRPEAVGLRNSLLQFYIPRATWDFASDSFAESRLEIRGKLLTLRGDSKSFDEQNIVFSVYDKIFVGSSPRYGYWAYGYDNWNIFASRRADGSYPPNSQGAYLKEWDLTLMGD